MRTARAHRGAASAALAAVLRDSCAACEADTATWNSLLPRLRALGLLNRLAADLAAREVTPAVPGVDRHLAAARRVQAQHDRSVASELKALDDVFDDAGVPFVLLKGTAYWATGNDAACGRMFDDLDLLVRERDLAAAERALLHAGWVPETLSVHDEHYYRQWMHQLPPMIHARRSTVVDLHHSLVPLTAKVRLPVPAIIARSRRLPGYARAHVPEAADLFLHAIVHTFTSEDVSRGVRDVSDVDRMVRAHADDAAFWEAVHTRAAANGLLAIVGLALTLANRVFATPLPATAASIVENLPLSARLTTRVFHVALDPHHPTRRTTALARVLIFVRGHWLKMPAPLLAYHVARKALPPAPRRA